MVEIGRTLVSFDIFREYFLCPPEQCKGVCCIEGDSGAPLDTGEADSIRLSYPDFKIYLSEAHLQVIAEAGFSVIDRDGDEVTPLVDNRQCAYSYYNEEGILKCSIEKAWHLGLTTFRKPVSCHLFPVRITHYRHYDAVNYEKIDICKSARECGIINKMPLYQFLKESLIRKYGENWYHELESIANDKNFMQKIMQV
jgi:hypothetical protein